MAPPRKLTLANLGGGDLVTQVDRELHMVCENIADPNTPADAVRTITVKIKVKADKNRNMAALAYNVNTAMPASEPGHQVVYIGLDAGEMAMFPVDTRQNEMFAEPAVTEIRAVSPPTKGTDAAFAPPHPDAS